MHRIGRVGRAGREGVAITLAEPREHRMLKTIERVTKQRITIEKLPTVADLHTRRLELTRAALHESLLEDDLARYRVVVETLSDEFDLMEIALAAVKLATRRTGPRRTMPSRSPTSSSTPSGEVHPGPRARASRDPRGGCRT